jgi:hypothetical protein
MRAEHEIAGEASNHPSGQLNHLGALDAGTTDAGAERTLWYRRRTVNADDQFDAAVNDQNLAVASSRLTQPAAQFLVSDRSAAMTRGALRGWRSILSGTETALLSAESLVATVFVDSLEATEAQLVGTGWTLAGSPGSPEERARARHRRSDFEFVERT